MTTEDECYLFRTLLELVKGEGKYAFKIEYGYGACEVPWIELFDDCKLVWSGTYTEFLEKVKT